MQPLQAWYASQVKKIIILENIRSAHNVGAMFRTADGAGVERVYLVGYTPTPIDRFGRTQEEIKKTSLGASESVSWEQVGDITVLVSRLQAEGTKVVAVEQTPGAKSLRDFAPGADTTVAFIFGNEVAGVTNMALKLVDDIVFVPMLGQKESLNVATTAGIVLYHDLV